MLVKYQAYKPNGDYFISKLNVPSETEDIKGYIEEHHLSNRENVLDISILSVEYPKRKYKNL